MALITLQKAQFNGGDPGAECTWSYDYDDVTLRLVQFLCVNNSDQASRGTIISQAPARKPSTAYAFDVLVQPPTPNGRVYRATVGGTSGASPPVFPVGQGQTVADGTVTWRNIGPDRATRVCAAHDTDIYAIPAAVADLYNISIQAGTGRLLGISHQFAWPA